MKARAAAGGESRVCEAVGMSIEAANEGASRQTFGDNACHPERSEGSLHPANQILRFAQDDRQDSMQVRSREILSPNV